MKNRLDPGPAKAGDKRGKRMTQDPIPSYGQPASRQADNRRKGLAIASLIIGIVSLLTCSLFAAGAIIGSVLGIIALIKARKNPAEFGGTGMAIAGIVTSAISIFPGLFAAIAIPNLLVAQQAARETAALAEVKTINRAQLNYFSTTGKGKFADLRTLGEQGLIDTDLASGEKGGYQFTVEPIAESGRPPMFDLTARPAKTGTFGMGNTSYYSNESYIIYEAEGGEPPSATPRNRVPGNGTPTND